MQGDEAPKIQENEVRGPREILELSKANKEASDSE